MKKYCLFGVILIASQAINCSPSKKLAVKSDSPQNVSVQTAGTGGENESTHARTDEFLNSLLIQHPEFFDTIIQNRRAWNVQVNYTQIDRNAQNDPQFIDYYWNVDKDAYFYPASTVKMPVAILALQKLKELKINGLDKKSTMITESAYSGQTPVYNDPTTPDGKPNVEQYIKKIFLVSDNDAFNRLYEFLGPAAINDKLHRMGYEDIQIRQRLQCYKRR